MPKQQAMPLSYPALLYRHLDRMSARLAEGLPVNQYHSVLLTSYYLFVLHFESLLTIHLSQDYYKKREQYMKKFPDFSQTWEGNIGSSVEFLQATSKWFQLLLIEANENNLLSFQPKTYEEPGTEEEIEGTEE